MKYAKARDTLPDYLIAVIQEYTDGGYLYIPRKEDNTKRWGESCGSRGMTAHRNDEILICFYNGTDVSTLAKQYFLSERTIQNIISIEKNKHKK